MVVFASGPFLETIAPYESSNRKSEDKELDNIYWLPGTGNPAEGMTRMKSEMSPMLNLLEFGEFHPGVLRPLLGVGSSEPTGWLGGHSALINFGQLPNACITSFFFPAIATTRAACCPVQITCVYSLNLTNAEIFAVFLFRRCCESIPGFMQSEYLHLTHPRLEGAL